MKTYPVMLDLAGRRCVVVGAGAIGRRRAEALAQAGADVHLVDPAAADAPPAGVHLLREPYRRSMLRGALLVFACTDTPALNRQIAEDARAVGALVNVADDPELCDFLTPAVIRRGEVTVAVGTGGAAPALTAELKQTLAAALPPRVGEFAAALGQVRRLLRDRSLGPELRRRVLRKLAGPAGRQRFAAAGVEGLLQLAREDIEAS